MSLSGNSQEVWKRWYLENGRAGNGADALDDYVEHWLEDADVAGDEEAAGYCWVDMATRHMTNTLQQTTTKSKPCLQEVLLYLSLYEWLQWRHLFV